MADTGVLASAAKAASYNMVLQLIFRVLTFVLNAFVLRYISKDLLGVVNVRLTLLYTTVVFIAREAFRRACLSKNTEGKSTQLINLLWLTTPIGIIFTLVFASLWIYVLEQPDPSVVPNYSLGVIFFAVSAILELLSEPLWVISQTFLFVRLKVIVEGVAIATRCILTVVLLILFPQWGILIFSISQIAYTAVLTGLYYAYFIWCITTKTQEEHKLPFKTIRDLFPKWLPNDVLIDWNMASLTWSFSKQSFLKQILTEGERYVMTMFSILSFADQGIYDVINNLGSLAARFIFLPIEDSGYLFFTQLLQREININDQKPDSLKLATNVLESLLKVVTLIGLTILVYGHSYSYLLLDIYGGSLLSSGTGPMLLRYYCGYVLMLAINGISECFVFATMSKVQVDKYNHKMLLFSLVFLTSSWYLTSLLGSVGFILANCCNMGARICHSVFYIWRFYKDSSFRPLHGLLPSTTVMVAYIIAFISTVISEKYLCCQHSVLSKLLHICIGATSLLVILALIYATEKKLLAFIKEQYHNMYSKKKKE
ncbi:unnamed protein product [Owenia fusiformis]|uniref:Protein RFT1 homolog n=1 Tax=Owenia fusiformis TaxID=6347 RepID=A0A8S4NQ55_OWEFU|nr:unnamed protein product [Owenia fusiformis]